MVARFEIRRSPSTFRVSFSIVAIIRNEVRSRASLPPLPNVSCQHFSVRHTLFGQAKAPRRSFIQPPNQSEVTSDDRGFQTGLMGKRTIFSDTEMLKKSKQPFFLHSRWQYHVNPMERPAYRPHLLRSDEIAEHDVYELPRRNIAAASKLHESGHPVSPLPPAATIGRSVLQEWPIVRIPQCSLVLLCRLPRLSGFL